MLPFNLHVLSMPPAFNLSQDQTLQFNSYASTPSNSFSPPASHLAFISDFLAHQKMLKLAVLVLRFFDAPKNQI
jgi:hypothetical protein